MLKPFKFNPSEPTVYYAKESRVAQQLMGKFIIVERMFNTITKESQMALTRK